MKCFYTKPMLLNKMLRLPEEAERVFLLNSKISS